MSYIKINQDKVNNIEELKILCPFSAIEDDDGKITIKDACRMCKICVKKGGGVFEFI